MNVCVPILWRPEGGGFYFLQSLSAFLRSQGHGVTDQLTERYDVLFTNHWMVPLRRIFKALHFNPCVRIVQRVDGAAQDYGRHSDADELQREVNQVADLTIFQSQYCRWSTRERFSVILQDGPVIHNPVDARQFSPEGERRQLPGAVRAACVTWSTNPKKGVRSIYAVAEANRHIAFILCGRYPDAPPLPNLHRLGVLGREELAATLRSCHLLLTFSEHEACPNHVLEALASGLPVLYADSGAMAEVVGDCGLAVTVETFRGQLRAILARRQELSRQARERALTQFHPQRILPRYLEEIVRAVERPMRTAPMRRYCRTLGRCGSTWLSDRLGRHRELAGLAG